MKITHIIQLKGQLIDRTIILVVSTSTDIISYILSSATSNAQALRIH